MECRSKVHCNTELLLFLCENRAAYIHEIIERKVRENGKSEIS